MIDKQIISDIYHLITWYQGRDVDRCDNVERWLDKIEKNEK